MASADRESAPVPASVAAAVLVTSEAKPAEFTTVVRGYDFNQGIDYPALLRSFYTTGYQATSFGQAIHEIERMVSTVAILFLTMFTGDNTKKLRWRLSDDAPLPEDDDETKDPEYRKTVRAKIFLGYTSNLISSGLRESLRFLAEHKMVAIILSLVRY